MSIPEEKINTAKERAPEQPKAKTVEIQTIFRYVKPYSYKCAEIKSIKDMSTDSNHFSLL
jgi:hypothetical protein